MSVLQRILDTISAATARMGGSTEDAQAQRSLERLGGFAATPLPAITVSITSAENSAAFTLPTKLCRARVGTTTSSRTLKIQEYDGLTWHDTGVEVTTNAAGQDSVFFTPSDMVELEPLMGREDIFRLNLSDADSVTVVFYPSN